MLLKHDERKCVLQFQLLIHNNYSETTIYEYTEKISIWKNYIIHNANLIKKSKKPTENIFTCDFAVLFSSCIFKIFTL